MSLGDRLDAHMRKVEQNKEMLDRVEHCIQHCDECNDWEDEFLDSVKSQLMEGSSLSSRQVEKLEQIEVITEFGRDDWEDV